MLAAASGTSTVAIGVTVVATLVVVALVAALVVAVRSARRLQATADHLARDCRTLLAELDGTVAHASAELDRVEDLIGSAESLSQAVGSASNLAYSSVASPVIKILAFGRGTARASRRLREGR